MYLHNASFLVLKDYKTIVSNGYGVQFFLSTITIQNISDQSINQIVTKLI